MKFVLWLPLCLFFTVSLFGQDLESIPPIKEGFLSTDSSTNKSLKNRVDFQLTTGISVGSFGKGVAFTSSYLAPVAKISLTPRFDLSIGAMMTKNNWMINSENPAGPGSYSLTDAMQPASFYAGGIYYLSPKLSLTGSYLNNNNSDALYYNALSNIGTMMEVGFQYEITPGIHIGGSISKVQYNNPFYSMPSPFYHGLPGY